MDQTQGTNDQEMSRRQIMSGLAWSVPAIATAAGAPAYAASPSPYVATGGMFNTVEASGYGYDRYDGGARSIQQGFAHGTVDGNDRNWNDVTGYPSVAIGNPGVRSNVVNLQGSYTPGGTTGPTYGQNFYGTGMWVSSPVTADGRAVAGSTTLASGAVFQMCLKIVGVRSAAVAAPSGYVQTNSLVANTVSNGTRLAVNGVPLSLAKTTWSVSGPDSQRLYTGQGCITFRTTGDLSVAGTNSKTNYTQLTLTPGLQLQAGLGNGVMLYCSTLSFVSGSFQVNVGGETADIEPPQLGTVTSYVRAEYDQSTANWPGRYSGAC